MQTGVHSTTLLDPYDPQLRSRQRRGLTMLGIFLVGLMLLGVSIYIDTASLEIWDQETDVGSIAMLVHGDGVETVVEDIQKVDGVTAAALTADALSYLRMDTNEFYHGGLFADFLVTGQSYAISEEYIQAFPSVFQFLEGRLPRTETEIALELSVAEYADVTIGDLMNYSIQLNVGKRPVYVCGIYIQEIGKEIFDFYYSSTCIVLPELLNPDDLEYRVSVEIDRTGLSPFDPQGSLRQLGAIERDLVHLYPGYPETVSVPLFFVTDDLATGVEDYMEWISGQRLAQFTRAQATVLLGGLLVILTVRFYIDERRVEVQILRARGASNRHIHTFLLKELLGLSAIATILALIIGVPVSRIAFASVDFLEINPFSSTESHFMISLQTMFYAVLLTGVMPLVGYIASSPIDPQKPEKKEEPGRLARLSRGLRLIRWDALLIGLCILFLAAIYLGGTAIQENPNIILIQDALPYPLFFGVASLTIKIMDRLGEGLVSILARIKGGMPLAIGGRQATRNAGITGPFLLVLVLSMCISINAAVVASSLPQTELNHARFAVGADINIQLSDALQYQWEYLDEYTRSHERYAASSFVNVGGVYLSDGRQGRVAFVAIHPDEYSHVGFDHLGSSLDDSYLTQSLQELETNPTGAIITEDLATEYELEIGEKLNAFYLGDTETFAGFTIIDIVPALSSPLNLDEAHYWTIVGGSKIWLNADHISALIDLYTNTETYYCVRSTSETNSGELLEDIIGEMGIEIAYLGRRCSVGDALESYLTQTAYSNDRAIDSLLTILIYPIIIGAILIYGARIETKTRRQYDILRSMGAESRQLITIHLAEIIIIATLSLIVVVLFAPLLIANSIERAYIIYRIWPLVYPILIFIDPVWQFTLPLVILFVLTMLLVSGLAFCRGHRRGFFGSLSSYWTKSIVREGFE
jgi:ABC-type lipoprotein release transport system permease subunit